MKDLLQIRETLAQFSGSEQWYKWSAIFRRDLLTDGAHFVAEECAAYWLMDAIASWQCDRKVRAEEFQVWHLDCVQDKPDHWLLWADDGNDNQIARQEIEFSDFPLDGIRLYAVRNELGGVTIMVPGEY
jgi:hypothetical protein